MIKVLILAYDFPPYVSVGGLRPSGWFNHFKKKGAIPIVVTRQWKNKSYTQQSTFSLTLQEETENGIIIQAPYKETFANKLYNKYGDKHFKSAGIFIWIIIKLVYNMIRETFEYSMR